HQFSDRALRTGSRCAQHSTGYPSPAQRERESHYALDYADRVPTRRARSPRRSHRPWRRESHFLPLAGPAGQTDLGFWTHFSFAAGDGFHSRTREMGGGPFSCGSHAADSMDAWISHKQHLVFRRKRPADGGQSTDIPIFHQLQHEEWLVHGDPAHHHLKLENSPI